MNCASAIAIGVIVLLVIVALWYTIKGSSSNPCGSCSLRSCCNQVGKRKNCDKNNNKEE